MSYIETHPIKNSTIMLLYSERSEIILDPPYQRMGSIWTLEKKQLLIDSILNDYDVPKIYFHEFERDRKEKTGKDFAVIDGRQRLESIWGFISGDYCLASDFDYQQDASINLRGLSYEDIAKEYPRIRIKFDSFTLPIVAVKTDDEDLIEDMFSRLNEAAPLNAAEKRNALRGELVKAIRELSKHTLFKSKVIFSNKRYQHLEISARFLLVEQSLTTHEKLIDTKKVYLDSLTKSYRNKKAETEILRKSVVAVLDHMCETFTQSDPLLRSQGNMIVYYLLFRKAVEMNELDKISRQGFISFFSKLRENRYLAVKDFESASFELLEFDRLTQQGTNDASNIKERFNLLAKEFEFSDTILTR